MLFIASDLAVNSSSPYFGPSHFIRDKASSLYPLISYDLLSNFPFVEAVEMPGMPDLSN